MPVIDIVGLRKTFGQVVAVDDVSFAVAEHEIFGVLGPNGAGKTTTVECVAGALVPDGGQVSVLGVDPARRRGFTREHVGYQLQDTTLPAALRAGEALDLYATFYPSPADPGALLNLVGLTEVRRRPFGKLSGGQRQRLSIALALVGNPQVAVFDELTTGLDPQGRRDTWRLISAVRDSGVTVVLVTHHLDEAERLCDRLAIIDAGRTRFVGTPGELADRAASVADQPGSLRSLEDAYLCLLDQAARDAQGGG